MSNGIGKDNHFAVARLYLQINERRAKNLSLEIPVFTTHKIWIFFSRNFKLMTALD